MSVVRRAVPIVFCPTGAVFSKADSRHLPVQPDEILADVRLAASLGITAVHIHARDESGAPTWDSEVFRRIIGLIRDNVPDLVINVSTSGRSWSEIERRKEVLSLEGDAKPEIASLTLSSMNFSTGPSLNSPKVIRELAAEMQVRQILPEFEIFDLGMANFANRLFVEELVTGRVPANIFFGGISSLQLSLAHAATVVQDLDDRIFWNFGGLGRSMLRAIQLGFWAGGGARAGLEDSLFLDPNTRELVTNAEVLERVHEQLRAFGLEFMSGEDYRKELGLGLKSEQRH